MLLMYAVITDLKGTTVIAAFVSLIELLSAVAYLSWIRISVSTGVIVVLYSLISMVLTCLLYHFPLTANGKIMHSSKLGWIDLITPFYFIQPDAAYVAEETLMKRNHNRTPAVCFLATSQHLYIMFEDLTNKRDMLKHNELMGLFSQPRYSFASVPLEGT